MRSLSVSRTLYCLFLASLGGAWALAAGVGLHWAAWLRLGLVFAGLFLAPGFFLFPSIFGDRFNLAEQLALWFALSFAILFFPVMACYLAPVGPVAMARICIGASTACALAGLYFYFFGDAAEKQVVVEKRGPLIPVPTGLCLVLCAAFFLFIYKLGGELGEDSAMHLMVVRKLLARPVVSLDYLYYADLKRDVQYSYLLWQPLLAVSSLITAVDPIELWQKIPAFLTPIGISAVYLFAGRFLKGRDGQWAGLSAAILLCCELGGAFHRNYGFNELNAPYGLARWCLLPVAYFLFLEACDSQKKRLMVLAAFMPTVVGATHLFYWVLCMLIFGAYTAALAISKIGRPALGPVLKMLGLTLAVSFFYLSLRRPWAPILHPVKGDPDLAATYSYLSGVMTRLIGEWHVISPKFVFAKIYVVYYQISAIAILAYVAAAFLFKLMPDNRERFFLTAPFAAAAFLMLNPIAVKLLDARLTLLFTALLSQGLPIFALLGVFGFLSARGAKFMRAESRWGKATAAGFFLAGILFLFPRVQMMREDLRNRQSAADVYQRRATFEYLAKLERPAVIFTDEWFAMEMLVFVNHWTTALPNVWTAPNDGDAVVRESEVAEAFDPNGDIQAMMSILRKRNAQYLLVPKMRNIPGMREKLSGAGRYLKVVFDGDGDLLYAINQDSAK